MNRDWANLPGELLNLISSKLFLPEDQLTFGLVCRSWYAAVPRFYRYPYLMSYENSNSVWKLFQHRNIFEMNIPELEDNVDIRCSKFGWHLMSSNDEDESLFFFNPFNNQKIQLPFPLFAYSTICFFNLPTSPDCIVVGAFSLANKITYITILKRGDKEKKEYSYHRENEFVLSNCNPVLHRGLLYWLDINGNIGTFDINDINEDNSWKIYMNCLSPPRLRKNVEKNFLIKLDNGEEEVLYAVFVVCDERIVKVYRLLEPEMKWEFMDDLGDKVLFVSNTASFGGTAPLKSMANKIYFPILHEDNIGVFYCLDTKKYHSYNGDFSSSKFYGLKEIDSATWVRPVIAQEFVGTLTWANIITT